MDQLFSDANTMVACESIPHRLVHRWVVRVCHKLHFLPQRSQHEPKPQHIMPIGRGHIGCTILQEPLRSRCVLLEPWRNLADVVQSGHPKHPSSRLLFAASKVARDMSE